MPIRAGSRREALEVLLRTEVAVVVSDVVVPDLDGFELASTIRGHPRFERTAIIFVSGAEEDDEVVVPRDTLRQVRPASTTRFTYIGCQAPPAPALHAQRSFAASSRQRGVWHRCRT